MPRLATLVLVVFCPCAALASSVTFQDGTFDPADWSITALTRGAGGVTSAAQQLAGGNPGAFREITNTVFGGPNPVQVFGFHRYLPGAYDPSTTGAIIGIDYSEDAILLSGFGQGQATGPALLQDGSLFFYRRMLTPETTWTTKALTGLQASDFILYADPISLVDQHPDFSLSGSLISVGFWRANSGGAYTIVAGIDSWNLTVRFMPIPEPCPVALLGITLCIVVAARTGRR